MFSQLERPCGVVVNMLDSSITVNEFEIYSYYYIHFQTDTYGKSVNLPAVGFSEEELLR